MKLKINDKLLYIKFENKDEEKLIKNFATYNNEANAFMGGSYNPAMVKKKCFGKTIRETFVTYAGLGREILKYCKEMGISITEFIDERTHYAFQKTEEDLTLYFDPKFKYIEHQVRVLKSMLKTNTGIIKATTSAGKSFCISAYIRCSKLPTLIIVNKVTLAQQLRKGFLKDGIDCGINTGQGLIPGVCMVSTIQSIKKLTDLTKYKCLIMDEVHNGSAKVFQDFFGSISYPFKFGFSATPFNNNHFKYALIRQFFGSIIEEVGAEELMKNEVIAVPDITFIKIECKNTIDYPSAYQEAIVFNKSRNKKILELVEKHKGEQILILIRIIEHGEALKEFLQDAIFVNGKDTSPKERMRVIEEFEKGKIKIIISSDIFNEGISISNINVLIIASGGRSVVATSQKLGRALRITDTKKTASVYDFMDVGNKFTEKHSKMRSCIYKKIGFKVKLKE